MLKVLGGALMFYLFAMTAVAVFVLLAGCTSSAGATAPVCIARCDVSATVQKGGV